MPVTYSASEAHWSALTRMPIIVFFFWMHWTKYDAEEEKIEEDRFLCALPVTREKFLFFFSKVKFFAQKKQIYLRKSRDS